MLQSQAQVILEWRHETGKINIYITKRQFFSRVWWQSEAKDGHGGDQDAGDDEVAEVVQGPPPDLDGEGDVQIGSWTTFVEDLVTLGGHSYNTNYS